MEKVVRDGNVAVLYSPGYGAGFSTWNDVSVFDPILVNWVLGGKVGLAPVEHIGKNFYGGGVHDLQIAWVLEGTRFRIDEYDGNESVILLDEEHYYIA